jgi:hypothetical protein
LRRRRKGEGIEGGDEEGENSDGDILSKNDEHDREDGEWEEREGYGRGERRWGAKVVVIMVWSR